MHYVLLPENGCHYCATAGLTDVTILLADNRDPVILLYHYSMFFNSVVEIVSSSGLVESSAIGMITRCLLSYSSFKKK